MLRAATLFNQYRSTKNISFLKKAIKLDPLHAKYRYVLAQAYFKDIKNHGDEALKLCFSAIKLNPTNPWYHAGLAWIAYKLNNTDISPQKHISIALKLDHTNPRLKRYLKKWGYHAL